MNLRLHFFLLSAALFSFGVSSSFSQQYQQLVFNERLDEVVSQDWSSSSVTVNVRNDSNEVLDLMWVDGQGDVHLTQSIPPRSVAPVQTTPGHVFDIDRKNGEILANFQVNQQPIQYYSVQIPGTTPRRISPPVTTGAIPSTTPSPFQRLVYNPNLVRVTSVNLESYRVQLNLRNDTNERLNLVWIDQQGQRQVIAPLQPKAIHQEDPRPGYVLQVERSNGTVVGNLQVSRQRVQNVLIDSAALTGRTTPSTTTRAITNPIGATTLPVSATAVGAISSVQQFAINLNALVINRRAEFATISDHQLAIQYSGELSRWAKQALDRGQAGFDKAEVRKSLTQASLAWQRLTVLLNTGSANGATAVGTGFFQSYRIQGDSLLNSASTAIGF